MTTLRLCLALAVAAFTLASCSCDTQGAPCTTDDNCPTGQVCEAGKCVNESGSGGGSATGGGGGGSATGGGAATGGGSAVGGGGGGTATGGGAATGGGSATGGGAATGGGVATGGGSATGGGAGTVMLMLDKSTYDFGSTLEGTSSAMASFTLTNNGTADATSPSISLGGTDATHFALDASSCPSIAKNGGTCSVTVVFNPVAAGVANATLNASSGGSMVSATLTGTGVTSGAITLMPTSNDFGAVQTSQTSPDVTFTVTNTGGSSTGMITLSLSGTDAALFTIVAGSNCNGAMLASTATCQVNVHFAPGSATGARSASLRVDATPGGPAIAQLTGLGVAPGALDLAPTSNDYGTTLEGTMGSTFTFTVTNTGGVSSGLVSAAQLGGAGAADFTVVMDTCSGATLMPNDTCTVLTQFAPLTSGTKAATLTVSSAAAGAAVATLSGVAQKQATLTLAPLTQDFGQVATNGTASSSFTVTNVGDVDSTVPTVTIGGANSSDWSVAANGCTMVLPTMGSCQVTLNFQPSGTGARSGTLTVSATTGGSAQAAISGTGILPGALSINPGSRDFGNQLVNTQSSELTFTVQNTGGAATGVPSVSLGGSAANQYVVSSNTCTAALASNGTCTVGVKFAPTATSIQSAFVTVSANPGGSTQATLTGTGLAPASLGINPGSWTAPDTVVGQATTKTFTITNNGDVPTTNVATSVGALMGFSILVDTCNGQPLPGRNFCSVQVQFSPGSAGLKSDTLTVSATTGGSAQASLSGTGLTPAAVTLAPAGGSSTNFGTVVLGSSQDETYVLSNTGQQTSGAITAALSDTTNYSFVTGLGTDCTAGQVLAQGATCNVRVHFAPGTSGVKGCSLTTSNTGAGGAPSLSLTGTGQSPANVTLAPANGSSVNFGTVILGSSQDETFVLSNTGQQGTGTLTFSLTDSTNYSFLSGMGGDCPASGTLAGGASCNIRVHFAPTTAGAKPNTLTISNTGAGGAPTLGLTGSGQTAANVTLAPAVGFSANFGTVLTTSSQDETFVLTNTGGATTGAMTWSLSDSVNYSLLSGQSGDCSQTQTLTTGGSCNIRVRFAPTTSGTKNCNLTTANTGAGGAPSLALIGVAQTPAALTLAPAAGFSINFGNVLIGGTQNETFVLTNGGTQPSGTLSYSLTGADSALFTLLTGMAGDCSNVTALNGSSSCNVRVRFSPTGSSGHGNKVAVLGVTANPGGAPTLNLNGNAQNPATLSSMQTGNNFGNIEVGVTTGPFTWSVSNSGDVPTGMLSLSNSNSSEVFTAMDTCNGAVLMPGGNCTVQVTMKAQSFGGRSGVLTYTASPGGSVQFNATATGMWRLTVSTSGGSSSSTVTSADTLISCPGTCTALYANNAAISLTSHTTNGSSAHFKSWSAPANCAASGNGSTCSFNITASTSTVANFSAITANLTFVSSQAFAANLGGVAQYDAQCNSLATAAGINNTAGNAYIAWISSSTSAVSTRFGAGVGALVRMDDVAFANSGAELLAEKIRVPNNLDEHGHRASGDPLVFTASDSGGVYRSGDCNGWTSNLSTFSTNVGSSEGGPGLWVFHYGGSNCPSLNHIYCMQKTSAVTLSNPAPPGGSKGIYWTVPNFGPGAGQGIAAANNLCAANVPVAFAGHSFKALMATTTVAAASIISNTASLYYQPNGVFVGTGADVKAGRALDGVFVRNDLSYGGGEVALFNGASSMGALATSTTNCTDWTSTAGNAMGGELNTGGTLDRWWGGAFNNLACNSPRAIMCVEP